MYVSTDSSLLDSLFRVKLSGIHTWTSTISNIHKRRGIANWILKFADDTKVFGKVNHNIDPSIMQDDINALFSWSQDWQMMFNVDKCKVMHLGRNNPQSNYHMNNTILEEIHEQKDLVVLIGDDGQNTACMHTRRQLGHKV